VTTGVVERGTIGQTFVDWPAEQRFLTPSFTGNGFGSTDLNAVHPDTSPAFSLGVDYPSGSEYAGYLAAVVEHFKIPVATGTTVAAVQADRRSGFTVDLVGHGGRGERVVARSIVWAGGEFADQRFPRLVGDSPVVHTSDPVAWRPADEQRVVVIGGYESGIDIGCHHVDLGSRVTVIDPAHPWDAGDGSDPSFLLAPRTRQRLRDAIGSGRLTLTRGRAHAVRPRESGGFLVRTLAGAAYACDVPPIAATGYGPGLGPVTGLFARRSDGWPALSEDDESTTTPGLFLSGPAVRHDDLRFCFVYKYRQRYAQIAATIGRRFSRDVSALEAWRDAGMWTDDLSCCGVRCAR
jgi:hypothetical protein